MGVVKVEKPKSILGFRHVQVLLLFTGFLISFCSKASMSLAIVAMTDDTQENTFDWSLSTQNIILSAFNWGYITLLIPGGELARRFGGKPVFTISMAVSSIICLLLPIAGIYGGWKAVCACRVLMGIGQSVQLPTVVALISKWIPLEEKGRLSSFIYSGGQLGNAIQLLVGGYIADIWSWPGIFYVDGVAGVLWTILYIILGSSSPHTSKYISDEERFYIQHSLQQVGKQKKMNTPWKAISKTVPVWALVASCSGLNWGYYMLLTQIPTYISRVLDVDIRSNGILSAVPYITLYALCFPFGYLSDLMIKRNWVSVTVCRKIFNSIASFGTSAALVAVCYAPPSTGTYITLLSIAVGITAAFFSGDALVHLDLAPNFASVIMGIAHFVGCVAALFAPLVVSLFVHSENEPKEWHDVFLLTAAIYIVTNSIFLILGSSERQTWNDAQDDISIKTTSKFEKPNEVSCSN